MFYQYESENWQVIASFLTYRTVEPIMLYGSEIWGTIHILSSKVKKIDFELENLVENFLCDKFQIKLL